jgi:fucose permease
LLAKQAAGRLTPRLGSANIARIGVLGNCATLPLPAIARTIPELAAALVVMGATMGVADVGINAHGVTLQAAAGRSVMARLHALYSIGGLTGAIMGGLAAGLGATPETHLLAAGGAIGVLTLFAMSGLLPGETAASQGPATSQHEAHRRRQLTLLTTLGLVGMAGLVCEGACADWSALYLHTDLGASAGFAATGYAAYSLGMSTGRLAGDRLIARFGGLKVMTISAALGGLGFGMGLLAGHALAAVAGFAVLGLGLAVAMPVLFSLTARIGTETGMSIAFVSAISGAGFMVGPPAIGGLAEITGLPAALGVLCGLTAVVAVSGSWLASRERRRDMGMAERGAAMDVPG